MVGRPVVGVVVPERADQRELVHLPADARQVLADADAGDVGVDRLELAAELGRRIGLQVPGVDGAEPAVQEQEDQRNVLRRLPLVGGPGLPLEQRGQRQAEEAGGAQAKEIAAGEAVAELSLAVH